jgi:type I restriction enzyme R subunit
MTFFSKEEKLESTILRIATIFTYGTNEDSDEAQDFLPDDFNDVSIAAEPQTIYKSNTPETNSKYIGDYNVQYLVFQQRQPTV